MTPALATAVDAAVTRAVRYLMTSRDERGAWKDFFLPAGGSDVWVTAFVGYVLATTAHPEARTAAEQAWRFLELVALPEGGWSYNRSVPGDGERRVHDGHRAPGLERDPTPGGMEMTMADLPRLIEPYPLTDTHPEALWATGHLVLRGVFSAAEIGAYGPLLRSYVLRKREQMSAYERDLGASPENPMFHLGEAPDAIADFVMAPRLGEIAARLLEVKAVRLLHFCGFFKPGGGAATPWHQDLSFIPLDSERALSIWIPLTDVSPSMGGLMFAEGSHRKGPLPMRSALGRFHVVENGAMRAGDISIHLGWTLHASRENSSGAMREAISVCYYRDGARIDASGAVPFKQSLLKHLFAGQRHGDEAAGPMTPVVFRREDVAEMPT